MTHLENDVMTLAISLGNYFEIDLLATDITKSITKSTMALPSVAVKHVVDYPKLAGEITRFSMLGRDVEKLNALIQRFAGWRIDNSLVLTRRGLVLIVLPTNPRTVGTSFPKTAFGEFMEALEANAKLLALTRMPSADLSLSEVEKLKTQVDTAGLPPSALKGASKTFLSLRGSAIQLVPNLDDHSTMRPVRLPPVESTRPAPEPKEPREDFFTIAGRLETDSLYLLTTCRKMILVSRDLFDACSPGDIISAVVGEEGRRSTLTAFATLGEPKIMTEDLLSRSHVERAEVSLHSGFAT